MTVRRTRGLFVPRPAPAAREHARGRYAMVLAYAIAMGWLEAVVVVYIRGLVGLEPQAGMPPAAEVMRRIEAVPGLLSTEQTREAATLVMLLAVGFLAARRWPARLGAFLVTFGTWDIAYYGALRVLLGWPPSLATLDLLFLIPPHPWWYQPVWVPVAISCGMIAVGSRLFLAERAAAGRDRAGAPVGRTETPGAMDAT
jgi:hypothetical protein